MPLHAQLVKLAITLHLWVVLFVKFVKQALLIPRLVKETALNALLVHTSHSLAPLHVIYVLLVLILVSKVPQLVQLVQQVLFLHRMQQAVLHASLVTIQIPNQQSALVAQEVTLVPFSQAQAQTAKHAAKVTMKTIIHALHVQVDISKIVQDQQDAYHALLL